MSRLFASRLDQYNSMALRVYSIWYA